MLRELAVGAMIVASIPLIAEDPCPHPNGLNQPTPIATTGGVESLLAYN